MSIRPQLTTLYLDLLEETLTGAILGDPGYLPGQTLTQPQNYCEHLRLCGGDWPSRAHTMIGLTRLRSLRRQVETVLEDGVPGDFIETGVWRGGACIFMRAILAAYGVHDRRVWVADSFEGLPPPNVSEFPADVNDKHHTMGLLAVSLEDVKANFAKYKLLDDQVVFLKGWFKDTLPRAPIKKLAILRLDGDMYESTIQSLGALYHKLSPGGYVIIDDYNLPGCRRAVEDFRNEHVITDKLEPIDERGWYWRKPQKSFTARLQRSLRL